MSPLDSCNAVLDTSYVRGKVEDLSGNRVARKELVARIIADGEIDDIFIRTVG